MKRIALIIILLPIFASAQNWQLVWQDEFNYTGLPDNSKWDYDTGAGGWGNQELENYTANRTENARVENGNLIIEARRDWYQGYEYSSARLVSRNKGDWKYGRIEVKAKIPLGQGLWPAIWMLPTDWVYGGWPASGEIDIMESFALGGIKPYQIEGNIHTQSYNHTIGTNKGAAITTLSNIEQNYHVYAVNWYANRLDFEVDGQVYFSFNNEGNWQAWPFDQRFHLILNLAVGGVLGTTPDPNIFPKQMTVDYVRVYEDQIGIPSSVGLVTVFDDCTYQGHSGGLKTGSYTLSQLQALGVENDKISSIKVTEGFRAVLFENDNFSGASTTITSDNSCLGSWNDKVSSIIIETNGTVGLDGNYYLSNKSTNYYMDVAGGPSAVQNGINIFQWFKTSQSNQQFELIHISNGCYKVLANHSGKSIDVAGVSEVDGANIQQWDYLAGDNQQFVLFPNSDGSYKLIAKHSGKVVEVDASSSGQGVNVQQWTNIDQTNGHWDLVSTSILTSLENDTLDNEMIVNFFAGQSTIRCFSCDENSLTSLYDISGKVIMSGNLADVVEHSNRLAPGIYVVVIVSHTSKLVNKVMKQ